MDQRNTLHYDFGYGERYPYALYSLAQVVSVEHLPGVYSWHLRLPRSAALADAARAYSQLFQDKRVELSGSTRAFGEKYEGHVERLPFAIDVEILLDRTTRARLIQIDRRQLSHHLLKLPVIAPHGKRGQRERGRARPRTLRGGTRVTGAQGGGPPPLLRWQRGDNTGRTGRKPRGASVHRIAPVTQRKDPVPCLPSSPSPHAG
jgi:hypothetical protein